MKHKRFRYFLSLVLLVCFLLPARFARAEEPAATVTFTNAPDEKPYLEIQKEVTAEPDAAVPDATFYFYVQIKDANGSYQPYRNQAYTVLDANGETVTDKNGNGGNTGDNAMVALKAGQKARFEYVGLNKEFRIEEIERAEQITQAEGQAAETIDLSEYFRCESPADAIASGTIGPNGATASFINRYSSKTESTDGSLTVQKKVSYPSGYPYVGDETFGFTLLVGNQPAKSESYQVKDLKTGVTSSSAEQKNEEGETVFVPYKTDADGHFTLKAEEAAIFSDLEGNQDYKVTEDPGPAGWRCVGKDFYVGSTSDGATVTFMNTNASFTVTKKLQKTVDDETVFIFQLFDGEKKTWSDAAYWRYTTGGERIDDELQKTDENGCFTLKANQAAVFVGIDAGTFYSVKELAPGELGYAQKTPASASGYTEKKVLESGAEILPFVNERLERKGSLTVTKKLTYATAGEAPLPGAEKTFTFRISEITASTGSEGEPMEPGTGTEGEPTEPGEGTEGDLTGSGDGTGGDLTASGDGSGETSTEIGAGVDGEPIEPGTRTEGDLSEPGVGEGGTEGDSSEPGEGTSGTEDGILVTEGAPAGAGTLGTTGNPMKNISYTIGADSRQYKTNEKGEFTLKEGETAVFAGLPFREYQVEEVNPALGYSIASDLQKQTGTLTDAGTLAFTFNNVYTARHFDLQIVKVDGSETSAKKLQGAKFMLYTDEKLTAPYGNLTENNPLTTNEEGIATLPDLREGIYYLKEVAAPKGYVVMTEPVKITVTRVVENGEEILKVETEQKEGAVISYQMKQTQAGNPSIAHDTLEITIKNDKGRLQTLPSTGGPGTGTFTGIGLLLIFTAAALTLARRRKTA